MQVRSESTVDLQNTAQPKGTVAQCLSQSLRFFNRVDGPASLGTLAGLAAASPLLLSGDLSLIAFSLVSAGSGTAGAIAGVAFAFAVRKAINCCLAEQSDLESGTIQNATTETTPLNVSMMK